MKVSVSDLYGVWHESPIFVCMSEVKSIDDCNDDVTHDDVDYRDDLDVHDGDGCLL